MGGFLLVMDSYCHVGNFQTFFVKIPVKIHRKKERRKFDWFWKIRFLMKKLVWRESLVLAELKNLYGVASKSTVIPQKAKDDSQLTVLEEPRSSRNRGSIGRSYTNIKSLVAKIVGCILRISHLLSPFSSTTHQQQAISVSYHRAIIL